MQLAPHTFSLCISEGTVKVNRVLKICGIALLVLWVASTAWELMARKPGETISIVGQLFFNVGIPSIVFFLILLWFLKRSGLDKFPKFMYDMNNHISDIKASLISAADGGNKGGVTHNKPLEG